MPRNSSKTTRPATTAFVPTTKDREIVRVLTAVGVSVDQIRPLIINPRTGKPIVEDTLKRNFKRELEEGRAEKDFAIAKTLFAVATNPAHPRCVDAMKLYYTGVRPQTHKVQIEHSGTINHAVADPVERLLGRIYGNTADQAVEDAPSGTVH